MMKQINKLAGIALMALLTGAVTSCSNDLNSIDPGKGGNSGALNLVKTPDAVAWSGNQTFGNTFNRIYTWTGVPGSVKPNQ